MALRCIEDHLQNCRRFQFEGRLCLGFCSVCCLVEPGWRGPDASFFLVSFIKAAASPHLTTFKSGSKSRKNWIKSPKTSGSSFKRAGKMFKKLNKLKIVLKKNNKTLKKLDQKPPEPDQVPWVVGGGPGTLLLRD